MTDLPRPDDPDFGGNDHVHDTDEHLDTDESQSELAQRYEKGVREARVQERQPE